MIADPETPQTVEQLRSYFEAAVDQLLRDLQAQRIAYAVPAQDVFALVQAVARAQDVRGWHVLESWMLRHLLPFQRLLRRCAAGTATAADRDVLLARARDLLGYVVLVLLALEAHDDGITANVVEGELFAEPIR